MTFAKQRLLIFFVPLLLSLPFLNRAYFVDDSYFVEIATWLKDNPELPYHFRTDDDGLQTRGWEENGFVRMVNPLVHQYYLAFLMKIGTHSEWFLRLGCVVLMCFSALFLFELARRWTKMPFLSTCLVLVTPVQWLTSHSLLIDSTMSAFFLGALYFFIRASEKDSLGLLLVSGNLMGLAILSKYPAVLILPLTGLWWILRWKKLTRHWMYTIPWIIALVYLGVYSAITNELYGAPHILAASQRMVQAFGWAKPLAFVIFFSGVTLVPLMAWRLLDAKKRIIAGLAVFLLTLVFSSKVGGFEFYQAAMMGLWVVTSVLFLALLFMMRKKFVYPKDHFLALWILGFIVMMYMVMGWVAARYFMIVVPAVVFMMVRMIEIHWRGAADRYVKGLLSVVLIFSAALSYADYKQANTMRDLLARLEEKGYTGGSGHYYLGDSFTMSYLKTVGWTPCFRNTPLKPGDKLLAKEISSPPFWNWYEVLKLKKIDQFEFPTRFPLKVMHNQGSAGFYASVWGALPFTFARGPWERFHVFEVIGYNND